MKLYYVYILKCKDGTYYTGVTNDIERRLQEHRLGLDPDSYTYKRRPVELVFYEYFMEPEQAIMYEKKIKRWSKSKKEALIKGKWEDLKALSECKNDSHSRNKPLDFARGDIPLDFARGDTPLEFNPSE